MKHNKLDNKSNKLNNKLSDKLNDNKILKLINDNKWDDILNFIKKNKIDKNHKIGMNNIYHLAATKNNKKVIKYYLKNHKDLLSKNNDDGDNCYHILAKNNYFDLLKICLKKDPESINLVNDDHNTILHILAKMEFNIFEWIIDNIKNLDYDIVNDEGYTILLLLILLSKNSNDIYDKRIKKIIKHVDLNVPKQLPPLMFSINHGKEWIIKYLIDNGANVNVKDLDFITPLILAIHKNLPNIVESLIKNGANINYHGAEGDVNPLVLAINKNAYDIANILLESGFDVNKYDRNMDTALHLIFKKKSVKPSLISELLYYGDLNIKNIKGDTPLHLLFKNYEWENYTNILENKKVDIFIKNENNETPFEYIKDKKLPKFLDITASSFINSSKINISKKKNLGKIKEHILNNKKSTPDKEDNIFIKNNFHIIRGDYTSYGKFNADITHNIIYTLIILKRNKNLSIPFQYKINDKMKTELMKLQINNVYKSKEGQLMSDVVQIYNDLFYEIAPYIIIWRSKTIYYVNKHLELYTLKSLMSKKIRFIFFKLTLVSSTTGTHANIIIFDKKTGILERFEPYGNIPYLENNEIDEMIKKELQFLEKYSIDNNLEFKYYSPKDLNHNISFQIISNDGRIEEKKLGDPTGYCLAWTYWYLEMRIKNPNLEPNKLIKLSIRKINEHIYKSNDNNKFIDFIREYANSLDKKKNKFMKSANINENNIYNMSLKSNDHEKLIKYSKKEFNNIVKKRV